MTLEQKLAEFAATASPWPGEVDEVYDLLILDLIGAMVAGSASTHARKVAAAATKMGSGDQCTVAGHGWRTHPAAAALVNGTSAHSIELDDAHKATHYHPGAAITPAALAVAEAEGCTGAELRTAVQVGYELSIRIAATVNPSHRVAGWHTTSTVGAVGAAAAAGRLLRLDPGQMLHAMAIAATQAGGLWQTVQEGTETKRVHAGFAGQRGIVAALLAREGVTGAGAWLTGRQGLAAVMAQTFDPAPLADLAGRSVGVEVGIKAYASCRFTHTVIEVGRRAREAGVDATASEFTLRMSALAYDQLDIPRPETVMQAQLSAQFCLALALLGRGAGYAAFEQGLLDPEVMGLAARVRFEVDGSLAQNGRLATLVVADRAGERTFECLYPLGEPENPMTAGQIEGKFSEIVSPVLGPAVAQRIVETVTTSLASTPVDDLAAMLASTDPS